MSPGAAIESPVFILYAAIAAGVLVAAGLLLALLRWGRRRDVTSAWRSYQGWLVMVPLVLGVVFLGRVAAIVFFTIVALLGFGEFARATGLHADRLLTWAVRLGIAACGVVSLVQDPHRSEPGWYGLFMALPVYVVAGILLIPVLRNRAGGQVRSLSLAIVGFVYFGWMFGHLGFLANSAYAYAYLLYVLLAVEINDVAAFTAGRLFGRHPLRAGISPNKTWEGSLGALAVSTVLPWLLRFTFPHFEPLHCILAGLIVGIGGQVGDLAISVIKRDVGIKDMGSAISGHGGVLDRIDSLIYVAPLVFHMVRWFHGL